MTAFKREQTNLLEQWGPQLEQVVEKSAEIEFYELPVLSLAYSPIRWWIDGGMKAGILESTSRRRTITIYTNKREFRRQIGIPDEDNVYVFLIDQAGKVIWQTEGEFTRDKLENLRNAVTATHNTSIK